MKNSIGQSNNISSELSNKYQISIDIPPDYDRSHEDIYHFKLGFIKARGGVKYFTPIESDIDKQMSAILARLTKISIPFNLDNLTWMLQQLGVTTPNAVFAGFVSGRLLTYEKANQAIEKADNLLAGLAKRYNI